MLYIPTFLSARILPKEDKDEIRQQILEFKDWLYENYTKDPVFWEENPYGWQRWQSILNFIDAEDHTHLLPDFKEYVNKLDSIRNIDSKTIFPELKHLL
jgi:phosphoglycolate phosphatase-like HAD superfamily hydrolase